MMKKTHSAKRKSTRHFLLLQGPKSPFFAQLASNLRNEDCKVTKINFNSIDRFFFDSEAIDYSYPASSWADFVSYIAKMRGVTDLVLFDYKKPLHADAILRLSADGVNVHVFANGYFDDNHITLERMGVNENSIMPREPMFYMRTPTIHSDIETVKHSQKHLTKDLHEISAAILTKKLDRTSLPFAGSNLLKQKSLKLALRAKKYFVVSLRGDELHRTEEIIKSFEEHTKDEALLIHSPSKNWKARPRVLHISNMNLQELVKNSDGMIVASSIDGIIALENEVPLVAMDEALFNFAGLTNQSKLLGFWYRRVPANPSLYGKFKNHISARTQLNGGFYGKKAIASALKKAVKNMIADGSLAVGNNVSENV